MAASATGRGRGRQEWETPPGLYAQLDSEFNFTIDAAASADNCLAGFYWDEEVDGLAQDWSVERVFVNPPFGRGKDWAAKAAERRGLAVLLVPCATDTRWWAESVLDAADEIRFIAGRVQYYLDGKPGYAALPMACTVLVYSAGPRQEPAPRVSWGLTWPGRLNAGWTTRYL